MKIQIRQEQPSDYDTVERIIIKAFESAEHSDGDEHNLVKRLRHSPSFTPELSLIANYDGITVGHILLTPIVIQAFDGKSYKSLALAPVSVDPEFQGLGIGAALINEGHRIAKNGGHTSIILLGHPAYYPRFGYNAASKWKIKAPFEVPDEAFMALELTDRALNEVSGIVKYPSEFGIE